MFVQEQVQVQDILKKIGADFSEFSIVLNFLQILEQCMRCTVHSSLE